jgi:hypothetical protein
MLLKPQNMSRELIMLQMELFYNHVARDEMSLIPCFENNKSAKSNAQQASKDSYK